MTDGTLYVICIGGQAHLKRAPAYPKYQFYKPPPAVELVYEDNDPGFDPLDEEVELELETYELRSVMVDSAEHHVLMLQGWEPTSIQLLMIGDLLRDRRHLPLRPYAPC